MVVEVNVEDAVGVPVGTADEVSVGAAVWVEGGVEVFDGLGVFVAVGTIGKDDRVTVLVTVGEGNGVGVCWSTAADVNMETGASRVRVGSGVDVGEGGLN